MLHQETLHPEADVENDAQGFLTLAVVSLLVIPAWRLPSGNDDDDDDDVDVELLVMTTMMLE